MKHFTGSPQNAPERFVRLKHGLRATMVFMATLLLYFLVTAVSLLFARQLPGHGVAALMVQAMIGIWLPALLLLPVSIWGLRKGRTAFSTGICAGIGCLGIALAIAAIAVQKGFRL